MSSEALPRRLDKAVDEIVKRLLGVFDFIAGIAHCKYFVAGTAAVDLMTPGWRHAHHVDTYIDFGVLVEGWSQFEILKACLVGTGEFVAAEKAPQRLFYVDGIPDLSIPVDLIPFGEISSDDRIITWRPGGDVMSVAGFEEALRSSALVEIADDLYVRVASVPGLTLLKLAAWANPSLEAYDDPIDLYQLLTTYDQLNSDRLGGDEIDLLIAAEFNEELAGAELLGRDVAAIGEPQLVTQIRSLLELNRNRERLARHLVPGYHSQRIGVSPRTDAEVGSVLAEVDGVTKAFCRGLTYPR
jgi:predicted nucleotidyltransferase